MGGSLEEGRVIALDLGELTIALEVENNLGRGLAQAKREVESLSPAVQREMGRVSRIMDNEGQKAGGFLARGMRSGLIRNSPLIVAGVGAALAAGAPLMLAAAGTLFAGIGAVAAAQTLEVRSAWSELGREIRDGAVSDAAVLVPVFTQMASEIGAAFQRLRPQLRDAFEASAPLIERFTAGLTGAAENAMPGLVRAVQGAGPVFAGLQAMLESIGTGLSEFFDAISAHSPAAGTAFEAIGDIVGALLPILGELLGTGAELASIVLPPLAAALGVVADAAGALGPILPAIVAGLTALKVARTVSPYLSQVGGLLGILSQGGGKAGTAMGAAGIGVGALGRALPVLAVVLGAATAQFQAQQAQVDEWTTAILAGGDAAEEAALKAKEAQSGFNEFIDSMQFGDQTSPFEAMSGADDEDRFEEAQVAADRAKKAREEFARESARTAAQELATAYAISGVTSAMIAQADQALAAVDSGFAYRRSVDQLEDSQAALNTAVAEFGPGSEEAQRAQLGLEEQNYRVAQSWAQQQADLSGLTEGSDAYNRFIQEQMLVKLLELQAAAGPEMAAAIGEQIAALQAGGVALSTTGANAVATAQQMRDLGLKVTEIPGSKAIVIDAPTEDQRRRLKDLGLIAQTMPNGKIIVVADTSPAAGTLAAFMNQRRTIQLEAIVATGAARTALGGLGGGGGFHERAAGGPVWPGQTFLVGEEGPELVRFAGRGEVIPADQTAAIARGAQPASSAAAPVSVAGGDRSTHIVVTATTSDERRIAAAISRRQQTDAFLATVR